MKREVIPMPRWARWVVRAGVAAACLSPVVLGLSIVLLVRSFSERPIDPAPAVERDIRFKPGESLTTSGSTTLGDATSDSWSYYDGCNTTTCSAGGLCTTTLVACSPLTGVGR